MLHAFHKIFASEECFESRADRRRLTGARPKPAKKTTEEREASRKQRDRARSQDSKRVLMQEKGERRRYSKRAHSETSKGLEMFGGPHYITYARPADWLHMGTHIFIDGVQPASVTAALSMHSASTSVSTAVSPSTFP